MVEVYRSDVIPASVERVWRTIRDFNALPMWTPFVADSRIEAMEKSDRIGCVRNFKLRDGGTIREQLLALDDQNRSCTYSILEAPMNVSNYVATFKLSPITVGGHTFAEWSANFDCPEPEEAALVRLVGDDVFASAFAHLRKRFGATT